MRKPRRQNVARSRARTKTAGRPTRERTSVVQSMQGLRQRRAENRLGEILANDPGRIAAPWNALAGELYSFGSRRLNRVMRASSRCVAARSLDEVAEVQSQFMLDLLNDYVDETGRVISACVRALEQNVDTLYSAGEAIGTRMSGNGSRAIAPMIRDPFVAARTATIVQ
jgi:hypothetical protein